VASSFDPGSGLRSKLAHLVGLTAADEVNHGPAVKGSHEGSRLLLKQMIERKQYNDAVRQREFDKLRRVRLAPIPAAGAGAAQMPDFQDSWGYSVYEERANTLKKIDAIEAQMSKQWWASHGGALAAPQVSSQSQSLDSAFATTMPTDLADVSMAAPTRLDDNSQSAIPDTQMPRRDARDTTQVLTHALAVSSPEFASVLSGASDPAVEEAAIRFANGDDGGAEAVLIAALQQRHTATTASTSWFYALLDIYRATSQQASFERTAADLAQRHGTHAPAWHVSVTPTASRPATTSQGADKTQAADGSWQCPALLDAAAVLDLQAWTQATSEPWHLDWQRLQTITPPGAQALLTLLAAWSGQALRLFCDSIEPLQQLLQRHTPLGDARVPQLWWQLRLNWLRLTGQHDDFELVALDFCVTYEISPPSWQAVRCQVVASGQSAAMQAMWHDVAAPHDGGPQWNLTGEVLGDVSLQLPGPANPSGPGNHLTISCAQLLRVDFSAGGSLLNWLANAQAAGHQISLVDVPQLLMTFFILIGINEHARIVVRNY